MGVERTPGPWHVPTDHKEAVRSDEKPIAYMSKASDVPTMRANAKFIAAGPEVFDALVLMRDAETPEEYSVALDFAEAAIAKAKGEAP